MTAPRIVVPGATIAITRRTTLRKSFLAPWHPMVDQLWLYSLADAQRVYDVDVHQSVKVINHHHTSVTPARANLPEFTQRVHRDFSCALHTLLCEERYDAPREVFDDRPTHMMRLMDAEAQAGHLLYEQLNPVAAGLVQQVEDMPQLAVDFRLWRAGAPRTSEAAKPTSDRMEQRYHGRLRVLDEGRPTRADRPFASTNLPDRCPRTLRAACSSAGAPRWTELDADGIVQTAKSSSS